MLMPRVRINAAAGFVFDREVQLERACDDDRFSGKDAAVVGKHCRPLILIFDVYRAALKQVAIALKDEGLSAFLHNGLGRYNQPVRPFFNRNEKLHSLAGLVLPSDEAMALGSA